MTLTCARHQQQEQQKQHRQRTRAYLQGTGVNVMCKRQQPVSVCAEVAEKAVCTHFLLTSTQIHNDALGPVHITLAFIHDGKFALFHKDRTRARRGRLGQHEPLAGPNLMTRKINMGAKQRNYNVFQAAEAIATRSHADDFTIRIVENVRKQVDNDSHRLCRIHVNSPHIAGE